MSIAELAGTPISSDQPAGEDIRYTPAMDALAEQMEKLNNPSAGAIDWNAVESSATAILSTTSKNLLVACYLAAALEQKSGIAGMGEGVRLLKSMSENFWESMYPEAKRMRGRQQAIQWWADRCSTSLKSREQQPQQQELLAAIAADLEAFDAFLAERMEEPPSLFDLKGLLAMVPAIAETKPEPPATPSQEAQGSTPPKAAASPAATQPSAPQTEPEEITDESSALKTLKKALEAVGRAGGYFMESNRFDPRAYLYTRMAAWSMVDEAPPASARKTMIPPPPKQLKQTLQSLRENENWENLLTAAEEHVGQYLFWFDLSCYSAAALDQLNEQRAAELVEKLTAEYAVKVKGADRLTFADGTPFASDETRVWLKTIMDRHLPKTGGQGPSAGGADPLRKAIADDMEKARELKKSASAVDAIRHIEEGVARSASGLEAALRRSALAGFLLETKQEHLALPHLELLVRDVDASGLDHWDPPTALQLLSGAYMAYRAQEGTGGEEEARLILRRIAAISPSTAASLVF